MGNDFDLDNFKKTWQEQEIEPLYEKDEEIVNLLNKKSRNYVKYIFWISVAEFIFFLGFNLFAWIRHDNGEGYFGIIAQMGLKVNDQIKSNFYNIYFVFKSLSLIIVLCYVWIFYRKYKRINVESDLKHFILQIVSFKKSVNRFILFNVLVLVFFLLLLSFFPIFYIKDQHIEVSNSKYQGFIIALFIGGGLGILLIILYYKLVYGIIMRKLSKNLDQLEEIDKLQ